MRGQRPALVAECCRALQLVKAPPCDSQNATLPVRKRQRSPPSSIKVLCTKTTHTARVQQYRPCRYKVMVPSRKAPRGKPRAQILGPYRSWRPVQPNEARLLYTTFILRIFWNWPVSAPDELLAGRADRGSARTVRAGRASLGRPWRTARSASHLRSWSSRVAQRRPGQSG